MTTSDNRQQKEKKFRLFLSTPLYKPQNRTSNHEITRNGDLIVDNIKTYDEFVPEIGAVAMEDIFTESEKLAITQRFDETATKYKKSAFNTAIQTALINKEVVELSEETLNKFDSLLKALNTYKFV